MPDRNESHEVARIRRGKWKWSDVHAEILDDAWGWKVRERYEECEELEEESGV
jgi:hypothetical protein